jgi:hypothetical protein
MWFHLFVVCFQYLSVLFLCILNSDKARADCAGFIGDYFILAAKYIIKVVIPGSI